MLRHAPDIKLVIALTLTTVTLCAGPAFAQSQELGQRNQQKDVAGEVQTLKAENAVVRELLRKMEEQQSTAGAGRPSATTA